MSVLGSGRNRELAARKPARLRSIDETAVDEPAEAIPRMLGTAASEATSLTALALPKLAPGNHRVRAPGPQARRARAHPIPPLSSGLPAGGHG